jgi:hypothetical protein
LIASCDAFFPNILLSVTSNCSGCFRISAVLKSYTKLHVFKTSLLEPAPKAESILSFMMLIILSLQAMGCCNAIARCELYSDGQ